MSEPHDYFEPVRERILAAALPDAAFDGWSDALLLRAAEKAGVSAAEVRLAFPDDAVALTEYFLHDGDRRMTNVLMQRDLTAMNVSERIACAIRTRLEVDLAHREALRRAVTLLSLPISGIAGPRILARTVDAIWRAVGDTSTDFNFYTKRATLAGIFPAVIFKWFSDESEGFVETWDFLARRMKDVARIERVKSLVRKATSLMPDPLAALSWLRYRREDRKPFRSVSSQRPGRWPRG